MSVCIINSVCAYVKCEKSNKMFKHYDVKALSATAMLLCNDINDRSMNDCTERDR